MVKIQKSSTVDKAKTIDPWELFQMEDFSLPQIKQHVPALINEEEEIDYELALQVMFRALKIAYRVSQANLFAIKNK